MLKPYSMSKLLIAAPKNYNERIIGELHKLKVLHIVEHVKENDVDIGEPLKNANALSETLVRIRSISSYLHIDKKTKDVEKLFELNNNYCDLEDISKNLANEVNNHLENLKIIEDKIEQNNNTIKQLNELKPLNLPLDAFYSYKSIAYFIGYLKENVEFEKQLRGITSEFEIYNAENLTALFININARGEALELLGKFSFAELDIDGIKDLKGDIVKNLASLENENSGLAKEKNEVNNQLEKLKNKWKDHLIFGEEFLIEGLEKAEAPLKFATTKNAFVIQGWVPTKDLDKITKHLNKVSNGKIFIQTGRINPKDSVPVKLNNPKAVKPFEFFLDLYALPTYKEIDPTFLVFLMFPLLFGFMLGDIGYGMVTLILALLLRKKLSQAKMFFDIFIFSSISTIFFGILFGEVFGEEVLFGVALPHILSRAHSTGILLSASIFFGILHLLVGYIIGFINVYKDHGLKKAIYEKIGWILLFPPLIQLIVSLNILTGVFKQIAILVLLPNLVVIVLTVGGIILIFLGEGMQGVIELPSLFSNILSYGRLMAIGIASVMLAMVTNGLAKDFFHGGILMIFVGILILIIGHTLNIAIGWLGCFLQSLRLHYVEFFTKFFKGGAHPYKPFGI